PQARKIHTQFSLNHHTSREQGVVRQDKQHALPRPAEHDIERTLRHVDPPNILARRTVDNDLAVGHVHIATRPRQRTPRRAARKPANTQRPVLLYRRPRRQIFRLIAHIHMPSRARFSALSMAACNAALSSASPSPL